MHDVFTDISEEVEEGLEYACEGELAEGAYGKLNWRPAMWRRRRGRGSGVDGDVTEKIIELVVRDNWSVNIFDLGYETKS
jgi:hypothetical protein